MAERTSPQSRVNTRALEIVAELRGDLNGHKELDALQFANVRAELTEIKTDINQLNRDAKEAIEKVAKQNDEHHSFNAGTLGELKQEMAAMRIKSDSERGVVNFLFRNLPTLFTAGTFAYLIWGPK